MDKLEIIEIPFLKLLSKLFNLFSYLALLSGIIFFVYSIFKIIFNFLKIGEWIYNSFLGLLIKNNLNTDINEWKGIVLILNNIPDFVGVLISTIILYQLFQKISSLFSNYLKKNY